MLDRFVIKPSGRFALLLMSAHFLMAVSVWCMGLAIWVRMALSLLILLSLLYHLYRHVLLLDKQSWRAFSLDNRRVVVDTRGGGELHGDISHRTVVISWLVVLCVKLDGHPLPTSQVVFFDALQADAFRELCVRLKYAQ